MTVSLDIDVFIYLDICFDRQILFKNTLSI